MGKGPSSITQTTRNPTGEAQLPYLTYGWDKAKDLYQNSPYNYTPNQTLAPNNPGQVQGYSDIFATGNAIDQTMRPTANSTFYDATTGKFGWRSNPGQPTYNDLAGGGSMQQDRLRELATRAMGSGADALAQIGGYAPTAAGYGGQAAGYGAQAAAGGGGFQDQLAKTAAGDYLNPGSNPYLADYVKAAQDPTMRAYQTATAPQTDANYAKAGRYGSGALLGARGQNEQNLGDALGKVATNIYAPAYENERARQTAAAGTGWDLQNRGLGLGITGAQAGITGADTAANIAARASAANIAGLDSAGRNTQADLAGREAGATGLSNAFTSGNSAALSALGQYPTLANAQYTAASNDVQAGAGQRTLQQQQLDDVNKRFYGEQSAPFDALQMYLKNITGGGVESAGSSQTSPNFQNTGVNALSAITGLAGAAKALGGLGAGAGAAGAAPALAAWIICTELMRQGKLDRRHWRAGSRVFANYPEIGKRGYYVWAIPSVRHLRRKPDSLYSRVLGTVFRWRAEDLAARAGVRGARRLWRGRAVTAALAVPCLVLGAIVGPQDWQSLYREQSA